MNADLYDFWHRTENERMSTKAYSPESERKARNKKQDPKKFEERALSKEKNLKHTWQRRLENQINDLSKLMMCSGKQNDNLNYSILLTEILEQSSDCFFVNDPKSKPASKFHFPSFKKSVPKTEKRTIIIIPFLYDYRMMNPVHDGRYKKQSVKFVNFVSYTNIRMMDNN